MLFEPEEWACAGEALAMNVMEWWRALKCASGGRMK